MRTYPHSKDDKQEAAKLNAPGWMIDLLRLNPSYVFWGPHEDYMWVKGDGWNSPVLVDGWPSFAGDWKLDEWNEVVHFYFKVERESAQCRMCGGNGYHPDAHWVSESFYQHSSPFRVPTPDEERIHQGLARVGFQFSTPVLGRGIFPPEEVLAKYGTEFRRFCEGMRDGDGSWHDKVTQDEVDLLCDEGRLYHATSEYRQGEGWVRVRPNPVAEQINASQRGIGESHDAINRGILVEARCKRFGIPFKCPECDGEGECFTAPEARLGLVLWMLHPRKGASRGVEIMGIRREDVPEILRFLKDAARRNSRRFAKVIAAARKRKW